MTDHVPGPSVPASSPRPRRIVAGGFVRRTPANVRLAALHRACRADYISNAGRRAHDHRDDAFLTAGAAEAVRGGER
ncbi:hypothetical protein ACGF7W_19635 [Streptomyces sp. NPDC048219]|uniref:hypothetical protein n=1 Tax=Streptomyces sp. NPDC048219 TaxID=3365517 RepID=UPI00371E1722